MSKTKAPSENSPEDRASGVDLKMSAPDPLLDSLVFLTGHFGRAKSAEALVAGLAYDSSNMKPSLFCEAAERLGLSAKITKRDNLQNIPSAVLPVVLILKGEQACVLLAVSGQKAKAFFPETKAVREVAMDKLTKDYAGYALFIHPRAEFTNPDTVHMHDTDRHWFWSLVQANRSTYVLALVAAAFINIFGLTSPLFIMNVYDRVIPNNAVETGWVLGLGALMIFLFDLIMRTLRAYLIDLSGRRIDVMAARRIYDQLLNMKLAGRPRSSGSFASMLKDFDAVREFFTSATITGLVDLPFTMIFLFVIYKIGGGIALLLVGMIFAVVAIGFILQVPLKSYVRKSVQSAEAKHGMLVETIHGLETIKAVGADGAFRAKYGDYVGENALYAQGSRFVSGLGINIATYLQQIASIIIVLMGMYLVQDATLTMGGLIACVMLGGRAIAPIGQIANLMTRYHQAGSALKTLNKIMDAPVDRPAHKQFLNRADLKGKITLENVSFVYPRVDRKVLDGVSFTINAGEKVGVIGRIGSGKSTIARLMMGLYDPASGTILADDTDYRQIDPADLRRNIAYIAQDVILFSGSVRDNIAAGLPHATEDAILEASKLAGVHEFIARHPMGYDAPVGERGEGLSGGQRQAIALARAILIQPNIMICDEPTNAMDSQAEESFKHFVKDQVKNRTLVLITHKTPLLPLVDRLILLDQGKLIMDGPRDKVIEALQSGKLAVSG